MNILRLWLCIALDALVALPYITQNPKHGILDHTARIGSIGSLGKSALWPNVATALLCSKEGPSTAKLSVKGGFREKIHLI